MSFGLGGDPNHLETTHANMQNPHCLYSGDNSSDSGEITAGWLGKKRS